ncbi:MAG: hypothetical protein ABJB03_06225 [Rhodoglobus sp.]
MITVTEPQVWVVIGVFAAAMFGMIGIVTASFNRTLTAAIGGVRSEIGGVQSEIVGLRDVMDARFDAVDTRFDAVDAKFEAKFDVLDRDIQALTRQVFGTDPR